MVDYVNVEVDTEIEIEASLNSEVFKEKLSKAIIEQINPSKYGPNYLEKLKEIEEILGDLDFEEIVGQIEEIIIMRQL